MRLTSKQRETIFPCSMAVSDSLTAVDQNVFHLNDVQTEKKSLFAKNLLVAGGFTEKFILSSKYTHISKRLFYLQRIICYKIIFVF